MYELNFPKILKKIKSTISVWNMRRLTIIGKITIIKSLIMSKLNYPLSVLPTPPHTFFSELNNMLFKFIWSGGRDKVKRRTLISNVGEGGLNMVNVEALVEATKISWVRRLVGPGYSAWKRLFDTSTQNVFGNQIWLGSDSLFKKLLGIANPFWKDVILTWKKYCKLKRNNHDCYLQQLLWHNENIKIGRKKVYYKSWNEGGVRILNDLINDEGSLLSIDHFRDKFNINVNFVTYHGFLHALPRQWREKILTKRASLKNTELILYKLQNSSNKDIYITLLENKKVSTTKLQTKWLEKCDFNISVTDWSKYFRLPWRTTIDTGLRFFQYKILHRFIATGSWLFVRGIVDSSLCE